MVLKTAISTHLILDLQHVAWYMSQVNFKTPQVKSFFSQHDHFEYSHITVEQDDQQEGEALVSSGYWQVDGLRRELIRHHRDRRRLYMNWKELRLQFQRSIFWMTGRLTWTMRRARRRFFTRTTGMRRGRGFLTRWRNSAKAKRSTRSRTTTRSLMVFRSLTLIIPTGFPEET